MKGFKHVFFFTLKQTFKNKTYIASFIIFVLMMALMGPISYFSSSGVAQNVDAMKVIDLGDSKIEKVILVNETPIPYGEMEMGLPAANLPSTDFAEADQPVQDLGPRDAEAIISLDEEGYHVDVILAPGSEIEVKHADDLAENVSNSLFRARLAYANTSEEGIASISQGINSNGVELEKDYLEDMEKTTSQSELMGTISAFAILIFIVASMSVSYIIASVNEEKHSKLVETLLVSVRPAALLMGKILGMMTYILSVLICGYVGSMISDKVMRSLVDMDERYSGPSFDFSIFRDYGIMGFVIMLATVILGYLISGIISGIFGSACSSDEDISSATGTCMILAVIGYAGAFLVGSMDTSMVCQIAALVPPLSFYTLPVLYVTGRVGLATLLLSYLIQLVLLGGLFFLMARVYRNLLLSDKSKPTLKRIFRSMNG